MAFGGLSGLSVRFGDAQPDYCWSCDWGWPRSRGTNVGKESKTSEFGQEWIDPLRADIAALVSLSFVIQAPPDTEAKTNRVREINEVPSRIRLRFAMKYLQSEALQEAQHDLVTATAHRDDFWKILNAPEKVIVEGQKVLKAEWQRVKRGEWRYQFVLYGAVLSLLLLIIEGVRR